MLIERARRHKEWVAICILAIAALLIWSRVARYEPDELTATFLDVGQGDCAFIRTPSGHTMLIDGGGRADESSESTGTRIVEPFLRRRVVNRIDVVVLTHPHDDHIRGLVPILRDFRVGAVLDPQIPHPSESYKRFLALITARRIPYHRAMRGQVIDFGDGVRAEVLHPPAGLLETDEENDDSVVLRITCGSESLLMTGDAGTAAEESMLESGLLVRSDVLKVAHHGSGYASGDRWLDAVHPKIAVISVGAGNQFGHPSRETLERLAKRGVRVLRTDEDGAVTVTLGQAGCIAKTSISRGD